MSMTDEEIRKLCQYWNEHPEKFIEKAMGTKLKFYQKWWIKFLTSLKEKKMKQDSIFYDDYDMELKELLESMRTYPSLSEALDEICNEVQSKQDTISSLKKRIKYCKNLIEKKNLERELNDLYKKRKKVNVLK